MEGHKLLDLSFDDVRDLCRLIVEIRAILEALRAIIQDLDMDCEEPKGFDPVVEDSGEDLDLPF